MKIKSMLRDFKDEVKKDIQVIVGRNLLNYTTLEKNDKDNQEIKNDISEIRKELELHNKQFNEYQKQRIATDIMRFADALRSGEHKGRNSFKHVAGCYEIYKRLGGNHYIDEE
jgi:molecular chaperone GrpE (heat shock protein)